MGLRQSVHTVALVAVFAGCSSSTDEGPGPPPTAPSVTETVPAPAAAAPAKDAPLARTSKLPYHTFDSPAEALAKVLETSPRVIGFGEFHELTTSVKVRSALRRFSDEMVDLLLDRASDLVMEIWARDSCGEKGVKVSAEVQQATQRPKSVESDVVKLLEKTRKSGIQNHVLQLTCADYDGILTDKKEVDYEKLLLLVTHKLDEKTQRILDYRARKSDETRSIVVVYGGALHNNLYPYETTREFSYAPSISKRTKGAYVEVDLYVPEYVEGDEVSRKEDWFPIFQKHVDDN